MWLHSRRRRVGHESRGKRRECVYDKIYGKKSIGNVIDLQRECRVSGVETASLAGLLRSRLVRSEGRRTQGRHSRGRLTHEGQQASPAVAAPS